MHSFTEPLRRNAVTIGLSLLMALGVAWYVLGYLPAREQDLRARYFRVVSRIGWNMQEKIGAFSKRSEAMVREIRYEVPQGPTAAPETYRAVANRLGQKWRQDGLNSPEFDSITPLAAQPRRNALPAIHWQEADQRVRFVYHFEDSLRLAVSTGIREFVQGLLRPETFEHFLILGPSNDKTGSKKLDQIYYSSFPAPLTLNLETEAKKPVPYWLRDTTAIQATRLADLTIHGQPYKVFVQPVRLGTTATWLLCGAVSTQRFNAQRQELPENLVELTIATILLGMLALPFLKITLMGARERLSRSDVVLCGLSLVLGTSFLLLLSLSTVAKHTIEPSLLHTQLRSLARQVDQTVHQELYTIDRMLRETDQALANTGRLPDSLIRGKQLSLTSSSLIQKIHPRDVAPNTPYRGSREHPWQNNDQMLWINGAGNGVLSVDSVPDSFLPNLREREYFKRWKKDQLWRLAPATPDTDTDTRFTLESVVTFGRSGDKVAVYARPSEVRFPSQAGAGSEKAEGLLAIYSTHLRSLTNPILPPGYSFCVVDDNGEIKFHSDSRLNLSENILGDCEPGDNLRAAMFARDTATVEVRYQGREYMLRIQPLQDWPLFLVTLVDLHLVHDRQMQTLSLAATLLAAFSLLTAVFLALYVLLLPSRTTVMTNSYSLRRLWPRVVRTPTYMQIAGALLGGTGLLFAASLYVGPLVQLLLLPLVPSYCFLFSFYKLRLPTDNPASDTLEPGTSLGPLASVWVLWRATGAVGQVRRLTLWFVLSYNLAAWHWAGSAWGFGLLLQIALVALMLLLTWAGRQLEASPLGNVPRTDFAGKPTYSTVALKRAYSTMLLSWVVVLSFVPAIYCYHVAYRAERELQIRHAHMALAYAVQRDAQQAVAYTPFFFDTQSGPPRSAPASFNKAENNYRELVTWLHPSFDTLGRSTQRVLPRENARFSDWTVASSWNTTTQLQSKVPLPGAAQHFVSDVRDRHWGGHWYLPTDLLKGQSFTIADWGEWFRLVVGLVLLLVGLYQLLHLLARRVFNLDMLDIRTLVCPATLRLPDSTVPRREYRLCATESTYPVPEAFQATTLHLDCRKLLLSNNIPKLISKEWQTQMELEEYKTVALDYFDDQPHDPNLTQLKINALAYLQQFSTLNIVIASRVHPVVFADCGHTRDKCTDQVNHKIIWHTGDVLLDALADFEMLYAPMVRTPALQPYAYWDNMPKERALFQEKLKATDPTGKLPRTGLVHLRWFIKVECSALPFLSQPLENELEQLLLSNFRRGELLREDDIVLSIQQRAQLQFRQLWDTLTPHEHYVLYDVAQDGLVNSRDAQVLNGLLQKGLLVYNQVGLRLVNESFRHFILNGLPPQQALRIEREASEEAERDGTWARRSLPIFLALSAAALFIFVTQRSVLNEAQTFLTALTATLPLLYRFVSLTPFGSGATAAKPAAA
ncbi:cache domain-containing protein [Hymenobacter tibetensis]|uniref:Cache domain-containing protein n=1 Tax=Hymenobacter tibetensis TaxID=497967 RepID=A0ABY4CY40_9BACT|nr:cache domain-containing protein [Hymenobacter tibetensis]UOG75175.1 cache domain-containing protein [Hymenobacter tibetensis]